MATLENRIGKKISRIRRERDMTSEKLAWEVETSKGHMSEIENGNRLPSLKLLERIAKALEVDISELF